MAGSDTPRTDEYILAETGIDFNSRVANFARQLEREARENREAKEALEDKLLQIETWARAYPLDVFPEPDLKRAREVLEAHGMTLDAISASNMRHVLNGIMDIARKKT